MRLSVEPEDGIGALEVLTQKKHGKLATYVFAGL